MGPPDPKEIVKDTARDLSQPASDLNGTKGDALYWLEGVVLSPLKHRLESAHAAVEAALFEARRRVLMNEDRKL